ncbi:hypothetical protein GCM10010215_19580 [Streptomyces virginiae]|uniref:Uncharacterized protein n=1 Tax=Streptomyces virginiae TaxID=1961 RepID=A0ABQ3NQV9_STRVG|nr:hypothetical protein GCM10010215_19580 [Streptomyces virginiae]GHI15162.1 hypothetical protein Scinn_46250 [Streptomyces virginiae]
MAPRIALGVWARSGPRKSRTVSTQAAETREYTWLRALTESPRAVRLALRNVHESRKRGGGQARGYRADHGDAVLVLASKGSNGRRRRHENEQRARQQSRYVRQREQQSQPDRTEEHRWPVHLGCLPEEREQLREELRARGGDAGQAGHLVHDHNQGNACQVRADGEQTGGAGPLVQRHGRNYGPQPGDGRQTRNARVRHDLGHEVRGDSDTCERVPSQPATPVAGKKGRLPDELP